MPHTGHRVEKTRAVQSGEADVPVIRSPVVGVGLHINPGGRQAAGQAEVLHIDDDVLAGVQVRLGNESDGVAGVAVGVRAARNQHSAIHHRDGEFVSAERRGGAGGGTIARVYGYGNRADRLGRDGHRGGLRHWQGASVNGACAENVRQTGRHADHAVGRSIGVFVVVRHRRPVFVNLRGAGVAGGVLDGVRRIKGKAAAHRQPDCGLRAVAYHDVRPGAFRHEPGDRGAAAIGDAGLFAVSVIPVGVRHIGLGAEALGNGQAAGVRGLNAGVSRAEAERAESGGQSQRRHHGQADEWGKSFCHKNLSLKLG